MSRPVRLAVVGAGGAAQVVHLPILAKLRDVEIAGVIDVREEMARTIADRFEAAEAADSLQELPSFGDLDAALVCTPNDSHEDVALSALDAGLHVLCERPIATSSEAAARMIDAAREADRHLMVAMNHRYRLDLRHMRKFVRSGEIGEPFLVRASWLTQREPRQRRGWRRDPELAGGGVLMDLGVAALDAVLWTLDFPQVEQVTAHFHEGDRVEESAAVLLRTATGVTASVDVSWELTGEGGQGVLFALGSDGSAETPPLELLKEMETGPADVTPPLEVDEGNVYTASYRHEWESFLRRVRGREEPEEERERRDGGREHVQLMRVVEACYRSAREGREVRA